MNITNTHKSALGLPGGLELPPNVATPVHGWDKIRENSVVKAWLKAGILVEGERVAPSKFDQPDKDALVAKLAALGVKHHPNTGIPKLQAMLAEAEQKAAQDAELQLIFDAQVASGLDGDAWNALSPEDRHGHIETYKASLAFKQD